MWFGWSGEIAPAFAGQHKVERVEGVTVATVDLEEQDRQEYYAGYANTTLWPLFHYRIGLTEYDRAFDLGYQRVNERFADTLSHLIAPDDAVWVHDYHLIPLARALRRRGARNRIGFFLHTPFPAREVLTTLPRHRDLVESLFDYDLVGFHTSDWRDALKGYVASELGGTVEENAVEVGGRRLRLGIFPIGIDAAGFTEAVSSVEGRESRQKLRASLGGRQMIVGVDRLDYSKGIEERFMGYDRFLRDNPEARERVFLLQIATISRDGVGAYQELRTRLDAAAGRINGAHATFDWVPLRYVNAVHRRDELAGIYRAAHVGLVTPLRDGMNLVAKEYVAAQDPADPGVLILSRFAGAAAQMREALIVNPYSREEIAKALRRALAMPLGERQQRWTALAEGVSREDVFAWSDAFLAALTAPVSPTTVAA